MNLGPFYMDIKNVPKSFDKARVLKCLQVFEECGGIQVVAGRALDLLLDIASETQKPAAFIKRIHVIQSHGYECLPNTKVFRVVWSSRTEPKALSVVSVLELDGVSMPLCRFGRDVCSNCFSPYHRTSGCERAKEKGLGGRDRKSSRGQPRGVTRSIPSSSASRSASSRGLSSRERLSSKQGKDSFHSMEPTLPFRSHTQQQTPYMSSQSSDKDNGYDDEASNGKVYDEKQYGLNSSSLSQSINGSSRISTPTRVDFQFLEHGAGRGSTPTKIPLNTGHLEVKEGGMKSTDENDYNSNKKGSHFTEFALKYPSRLKSREFSENRVKVPMSSSLKPPLHDMYPKLAGQILSDNINGHFNCQSLIDKVPAEYVTAEHRGMMTSRGIHALPALTSLELSNELLETKLGSERFHDLMNHSALASTELNRHWLHEKSTHLEPMRRDMGGEYNAYASSLLGQQYGDF